MQIEPKDIFAAVVAGSTAITGLLFVLIGFLLSAKVSLKKVDPDKADTYDKPIWRLLYLLAFNSLIAIFGISWPLFLHFFIPINLFNLILMFSFLVSLVALIILSKITVSHCL